MQFTYVAIQIPLRNKLTMTFILLQRIGHKRGGHRQQDRASYGEYLTTIILLPTILDSGHRIISEALQKYIISSITPNITLVLVIVNYRIFP